MKFLLRLIGGLVLCAILLVAAVVWDISSNDGRILSFALGRNHLVADCTPPLRENLLGRGFTPVDLEFGGDQAFGFAAGTFGRGGTLSASFSFTDGENGPRVDGRMECTVKGRSVAVTVEVDDLPRRAA